MFARRTSAIMCALAIMPACKEAGGHTGTGLAAYLAQEHDLTRYRAARHDLDGDGSSEHIVLATSGEFCGTGGCTMLILRDTGKELELVSKTTVVSTPVRLLESQTNGWRDLEVRARIGATTSWQSKLVFDGSRYSANPTVSPAERVSGLQSEVIFD